MEGEEARPPGFWLWNAALFNRCGFLLFRACSPRPSRVGPGPEWLGFAADEWRAEEYISFVCKFMLGMGLGFEMPVVILTMVKVLAFWITEKLAGFRRYMIVINLVLGGVLTTPEVLTQVMMFIPLQLLYELSIWVAGTGNVGTVREWPPPKGCSLAQRQFKTSINCRSRPYWRRSKSKAMRGRSSA